MNERDLFSYPMPSLTLSRLQGPQEARHGEALSAAHLTVLARVFHDRKHMTLCTWKRAQSRSSRKASATDEETPISSPDITTKVEPVHHH
jgi:hypothetical protein